MDHYQFHGIELTWLDGGFNRLDGGAMFGPVPKVLWSRKYEVDGDNKIPLATEPILVRTHGKNILIESGLGSGKLTEKQVRNLGVTRESNIEDSLGELGLTPEDIDIILMTHLHNDHAAGLTRREGDGYTSVFPNAEIHVSQIEWDEMREPNIRSRNTYFRENWEPVQDQVKTFQDRVEAVPGIEMIHTGGHSAGHAIIKITKNGETLIHMADLMPTHAHQNPLWVLAFDDYPMDSIYSKERLMKEALENGYRFIFYHDAFYRMIQWDESGKKITDSMERTPFEIPAGTASEQKQP
ncbi:YtnP family quorum-quenching lactonase [Bhargavaea beijingensis]|uniref:Glyoxylase, beta-lactamase superfamily II n=1 Tax=Bhargavaea beijingensis TaxID=426756 RepID=A0A1G7EL89_9BACL|nr:MBL fold metallo-hydrolase [Bhargavaea beijingensis]MCW1928559.1 MBL fold metallo-hydrolase [Bhargavaea beijingensis]RSK25336.1 MBL fold metallo-hydrolase [Bhargavaea beijingensis]SDE64429.1 Glyoxylase, beta-lactamase superfamily II [Bhargavaea beijingensis]